MEEIRLIKSTFYEENDTKNKLCDFIKNADILSMGHECEKFEKKFSEFQGRKHSVFVTSGSAANLLLIQSLINIGKLKIGDSIGVSSLTWATNIMPLIQFGLNPILIDCEIDTLNISLNEVKKNNIVALFITNALGFSSDIDEIKKYCDEKKILLIEDNCESLGTEYKNIKLGNFGIASTFSFFVGHHLSTIEGGMICTDDDELHKHLLISRAHGWTRNLPEEYKNNIENSSADDIFYEKYKFYELAFNARPTEINGFIGNVQMNYIDKIIEIRESNFKKINEHITNNPDLINLNTEKLNKISNFGIPFIFKDKIKFNKYKELFEKNKVEIRPIISGNMQKQPFFKKHIDATFSCPNADFIHENGFYCGNNPELTEDELNRIINIIKNE